MGIKLQAETEKGQVVAARLRALPGRQVAPQRRRHVGLENTIYLPGRSNPSDSNERLTANPEEYFHVLEKK